MFVRQRGRGVNGTVIDDAKSEGSMSGRTGIKTLKPDEDRKQVYTCFLN